MDVSVEVHCAGCGSANYGLPEGAGDEAVVCCNDCGRRLGSVAELKAEMMAQAVAHSAEALRAEMQRILAKESG